MPLTPMTININLKSALSSQQIPVDVPSTFTVAISKQPTLMQNAATRLLGLNKTSIEELASEIIFGQLRDVVAQLTIEELINDRNSFLSKISDSVESELAKIGLELINVNITDITDESGYIVALGKKAASQALNQARIEEAENNKSGEVGVSLHEKEQRTLVAENNAEAIIGEKESERKKRIATSQAEALAIKGENETAAQIEQSNADREVEIAEANKRTYVARKVKQAEAEKDSYSAQREAAEERAKAEKAQQIAQIIVPAEIEKDRRIIEAEASAKEVEKQAEAQANAIFKKLEAQAKGEAEILNKKAEAFKDLIDSTGSADAAAMLLLTEKLPELETIKMQALKNIKFDKVVVWDNGGNGNGESSTSNFIKGFMESIPAYHEIYKLAGLKVPTMLQGGEHKDSKDSKKSTVGSVAVESTVSKESAEK
jgi:flotillin